MSTPNQPAYDGPITRIQLADGTVLMVRGGAADIKAQVSEKDASLRSWVEVETGCWRPSV